MQVPSCAVFYWWLMKMNSGGVVQMPIEPLPRQKPPVGAGAHCTLTPTTNLLSLPGYICVYSSLNFLAKSINAFIGRFALPPDAVRQWGFGPLRCWSFFLCALPVDFGYEWGSSSNDRDSFLNYKEITLALYIDSWYEFFFVYSGSWPSYLMNLLVWSSTELGIMWRPHSHGGRSAWLGPRIFRSRVKDSSHWAVPLFASFPSNDLRLDEASLVGLIISENIAL